MARKPAATVDHYLELHPEWAPALRKLRRVLRAAGLEETVKWGAPCYALDGKNVVGLAAFKRHVALWFHQGVFLADPDGVLVNAQEGTTKALRQWRFASAREIPVARVAAYVAAAVRNQRQGLTQKPARRRGVDVPPELRRALARKPEVDAAFAALTEGRRREYAEHVAAAKRAETKTARIAKILPMIAAGVGLNDRYRSC